MRIGIAAVGTCIGLFGTAVSVQAAPSCSVEALNALHVPDVIRRSFRSSLSRDAR